MSVESREGETRKAAPMAFRSFQSVCDHFGKNRTRVPSKDDEAGALAVVELVWCGHACCPSRMAIEVGGHTRMLP